MLDLITGKSSDCTGLSRREFLRLGGLSALGLSLPAFLRNRRAEAAQPSHPAGEVFFRGDSESLSDEEATQIAQRQLVKSGLLRGQRVRVVEPDRVEALAAAHQLQLEVLVLHERL